MSSPRGTVSPQVSAAYERSLAARKDGSSRTDRIVLTPEQQKVVAQVRASLRGKPKTPPLPPMPPKGFENLDPFGRRKA